MTGNAKVFLDSNILIYLLDNGSLKKQKAENFLRPEFYISTQVISENANVCLRKLKLTKEVAFAHARGLMERFHVLTIGKETITLCFHISTKYNLSYWDSLIAATALEADCNVLYSEDLQDKMILENRLTILNPFNNL
jgi:predicted nucleic acid-binding protein